MGNRFFETTFTPSVKAEQEKHGSRTGYEKFAAKGAGEEINGALGAAEIQFIGSRDSFYLSSVSGTGWPYLQHRGGPPGFARVLDERTIAWADFSGNRQYISIGNGANDDRVALFFMDYPNHRRLKVLGHVRVAESSTDKAIADGLAVEGYEAVVEHQIHVRVVAFDWNCPQHITPRFTVAEVERMTAPLRRQISDLEARISALAEQPHPIDSRRDGGATSVGDR